MPGEEIVLKTPTDAVKSCAAIQPAREERDITVNYYILLLFVLLLQRRRVCGTSHAKKRAYRLL